MTLDQLRAFLTVAELSHVTLAAQRLNITQSALSNAIKTLERNHDVVLFNRVGRGIELSEAGHAFRLKALKIMSSVREAEDLLNDLNELRQGHLRVWSSQTVASQWLPRHLVEFQAQYPQIKLETEVSNTLNCARAILLGQADLAVVEGEDETPGLVQEIVARDRLAVVASPAHPFAGKACRSLADLGAARWILREAGSGTRATFEEAMRREGGDPAALQVDLEFHTNESLCAALECARHLSVMSLSIAEPLFAANRLALIYEGGMDRHFRLLRHRERHISAAAERFVARIKAEVYP